MVPLLGESTKAMDGKWPDIFPGSSSFRPRVMPICYGTLEAEQEYTSPMMGPWPAETQAFVHTTPLILLTLPLCCSMSLGGMSPTLGYSGASIVA